MELVCFRTRQRLRTKVIFVLLNTPLLLCCSHLLFFYLLSLPISSLISFSFFFLWHFPFLSFPYLLSPLSLPLPILSLRSWPITSLIPSFFFLKFFPFPPLFSFLPVSFLLFLLYLFLSPLYFLYFLNFLNPLPLDHLCPLIFYSSLLVTLCSELTFWRNPQKIKIK